MKITLREDLNPDLDRYYRIQFRIYNEPYLIWDRDFWEMILTTSYVFRIEVDGMDAGNIIFERIRRERLYIVDFSLLPEYQKKGIGTAVLERIKRMAKRITAITREGVLDFFLKSGFSLKKRIKSYYAPGVDGYYVVFEGKHR